MSDNDKDQRDQRDAGAASPGADATDATADTGEGAPDDAGGTVVAAAKAGPGRRRVALVAVACAVALACAAGAGAGVWRHQSAVAAQALSACQGAHGRATAAMDALAKTLDGKDVKDAAAWKAGDVKDAKTVDTLAKAMEDAKAQAKETVPECGADAGRAAWDQATGQLDQLTGALGGSSDALSKAVKAVDDSRTDKLVDTATALYRSSDGKVADGRTRDALKTAIDKRDATAIGKATTAVNASVDAKEKADREAADKAAQEKAEADRQAAEAQAAQDAAAAAAQQAQAGTGATGGYDTGGYAGSGYTDTQQYTAPQQQTQQQYVAPTPSAPTQQQAAPQQQGFVPVSGGHGTGELANPNDTACNAQGVCAIG